MRLDQYRGERAGLVDFIKMDVQGAEGLVLEGMTNVLRMRLDLTILTEYWPMGLELSGYGTERFARSLDTEGFTIFDLSGAYATPMRTNPQWLVDMYKSETGAHTNLLCLRGANTLLGPS